MIGTPVIILHQDVTDDNADDLRVGINSEAYYNISDGWYYAGGVVWNKTAQNLVTDQDWSVSCSYDVLEVDDTGGVENNIKYDAEFTKLNFKHLALVNNPRYERANIVFNSKTFNIDNAEKEFRTGVDKNGNSYVYPLDDKENIVDFTGKFAKTPTLKDVKDYVTKIVTEGARFATLSPDWFVDTKVNSKRKGHIIYSDKWHKMSKAERDRHNEYVVELENLLKNAEYLSQKENTKKEDKKNVEKYHYFRTFVKIGENKYEVIFDTEQYVGESEDKPQTVHLYNVHEVNKTPVRAESKNSIKNTIGSSDNIITDIKSKFNPNVKEHEEIEVNNNKETEMALLDELKKLITKVENDKGEQSMTLKEKVLSILNSKEIDEETKKEIENAIDEEEKEVKEKKELEEKKEVKNEDKEPEKDKKEVEEVKKEVKKDVDNKCDKKADNSVDNSKPDYFGRLNEIYNAATSHLEEKSEYVSKADREKAAEDYFARS